MSFKKPLSTSGAIDYSNDKIKEKNSESSLLPFSSLAAKNDFAHTHTLEVMMRKQSLEERAKRNNLSNSFRHNKQ